MFYRNTLYVPTAQCNLWKQIQKDRYTYERENLVMLQFLDWDNEAWWTFVELLLL